MSEKVLLALMQLFSIILEKLEDKDEQMRLLVSQFLSKMLSKNLMAEYLDVYDKFVLEKNKKLLAGKKRKRTSVNSVKILRICAQINKELTQKQKAVVVIRLLEFIHFRSKPSQISLEFVQTVAESFNISDQEYALCLNLVSNNEALYASKQALRISNKIDESLSCKQMVEENFEDGDQIRLIWMKSTQLCFLVAQVTDELRINGLLAENGKVHMLTVGSSIRESKIKPIYYSAVESKFIETKAFDTVNFVVKNLEYKFPAGNIGFHKASFHATSGDFVGIMGASGSGKSTMLGLLNGSTSPLSGGVYLNGIDIHKNASQIEGLIGFVSQDDLLMEELTVFQNLFYSAKLSFSNLNDFSLARRVIKVLHDVGLYESRHLKVGNPIDKTISGGQRKRLNIALELIREPAVLFTDEPTSGLSSRDSEIVMDLLRNLTLKGKLVFVVIHQPSSDLFKMFDSLLILDLGGRLIFNGNPIDSISYFKGKVNDANFSETACASCGKVSSEEIFDIVESKVLDDYGRPTNNRKLTPNDWHQHYHEEIEQEISNTKLTKKKIGGQKGLAKPSRLTQLKVFVKRDILSKLSNTQYIVINLFEAPLLAFILGYFLRFKEANMDYIFKENENVPAYIFISIIVAMFLGLTVSAEEIIKDARIRKREQFLNLSRGSYLLSKVLIMLTVSAIQTGLFVIIGNMLLGINNMMAYWLMIYAVSCFSNLLGLNISSAFRSAVTIYILIPFLVIPQLLLSGVLVSFDHLNPSITKFDKVPLVGDLVTGRWAYDGIAVNQYKDNEFEKRFFESDRYLLDSEYKRNFLLPKIKNELSWVKLNYKKVDKQIQENLFYKWKLIVNESKKAISELGKKELDQEPLNAVTIEKIDSVSMHSIKECVNYLSNHYFKVYKHFSKKRDDLIEQLNKDKESTKQYIAAEKKYTNAALISFMRNTNTFDKVLEKEGRLIRNTDLVYYTVPSFRTHFYAPYKYVFGKYFDTYWVNMIVIWLMTLGLAIALYFETLKKLINSFELLSSKEFIETLKDKLLIKKSKKNEGS